MSIFKSLQSSLLPRWGETPAASVTLSEVPALEVEDLIDIQFRPDSRQEDELEGRLQAVLQAQDCDPLVGWEEGSKRGGGEGDTANGARAHVHVRCADSIAALPVMQSLCIFLQLGGEIALAFLQTVERYYEAWTPDEDALRGRLVALLTMRAPRLFRDRSPHPPPPPRLRQTRARRWLERCGRA